MQQLKGTRKLTLPTRILLVISFSCLTAFAWKVRGAGGWGSIWGMFTVGTAMTLFIFAFLGNRKKMVPEAIPAAILLMGITNGGWGTLNSQMAGILDSTVPFTGADTFEYTQINPISGLIIMLLLGFGWMPLFSTAAASFFSKKEYKLKKIIILICTFYIVSWIFKLSISHFLLRQICPEADTMFRAGLIDRGIDLSPTMAYVKNLGSAAWAKKIPYGRNYFTSIDVISHAAGGLGISLTALIAFKDKVTGFLSLAFNTVNAISITIADVALVAYSETGLFRNIHFPRWIIIGGWPLWEFFTGFFIGLGTMLILVCLPRKLLNGEGKFKQKSPFKKNGTRFAFSSFFIVFFPLGLTLARPIGSRTASFLIQSGKTIDEDTVTTLITVVLGLILFGIAMLISKKPIFKDGLSYTFKGRAEDYAMTALPIWVGLTAAVFFFVDDNGIIAMFKRDYGGFGGFISAISDGSILIPFLMLIALIVFYITFFASKKLALTPKKKQ